MVKKCLLLHLLADYKSLRWGRSFFELSLSSSLKRGWRIPPTTPWNQVMVERSRSLRMKFWTMLKIYTAGNLLTIGKDSRSSLQIHSETTGQWNASLRWSSRSTSPSTPSKISPGSDVRDQSNTILRFPGQRNIVSTTTAKGIKPSIVGLSKSIWRSLSSMAYSKSTSSLPKQPPDNQTPNFLGNNTWSPNTRRSINHTTPDKYGLFSSNSHSTYSIPDYE